MSSAPAAGAAGFPSELSLDPTESAAEDRENSAVELSAGSSTQVQVYLGNISGNGLNYAKMIKSCFEQDVANYWVTPIQVNYHTTPSDFNTLANITVENTQLLIIMCPDVSIVKYAAHIQSYMKSGGCVWLCGEFKGYIGDTIHETNVFISELSTKLGVTFSLGEEMIGIAGKPEIAALDPTSPIGKKNRCGSHTTVHLIAANKIEFNPSKSVPIITWTDPNNNCLTFMIDSPVEQGYLTVSADVNLIFDSGVTPWAAQILYNMLDRSYTEIEKNKLPHTPPKGLELPYTGQAQTLIEAGQVDADKGTMEYSLDKTTWSTELPKGTKPGTYSVYWRITAKPGYWDIPMQTVTAKITSVYTPPETLDLTYNGSDQELIDPDHSGSIDPSIGTMQYRLSDQEAWSTVFPKRENCGTYEIQWRILGIDNTSIIGSGTLTATINPAPLQCTPPRGQSLSYTGAAQSLTTGGSVTGGTMKYSRDEAVWSEDPPKETAPGTYTVYWKAEPDANHTGAKNGSIQSTITEQPKPEPKPSEPDGGPRYPVVVTDKTPPGGTVKTNLNSAAERDTVYITALPAAGYRLQEVTAVDKHGNSLPLTDLGGNRLTFKMPACKTTVSASFVKTSPGWNRGFTLCTRDGACPVGRYTDAAANAWYHDGLHFCLDNGLLSGYGDQTLQPNAPISRGAFLSVLWRLSGKPVVNSVLPFGDVSESDWYAEALRWASAERLAGGYGDGLFHPGAPLTREQMAAILWRYAEHEGLDVSESENDALAGYADGAAVSGFAAPAMSWACRAGLLGGQLRENGRVLNPQGLSSRAQAAAVVARLAALLKK